MDESSFTNDDVKGIYLRSKLLAEKEAWKIYEANKDKLNLTVINPAAIYGKLLTSSKCASIEVYKQYFTLIGIPDLKLGIVNVHDVALAHIRAMERPEVSRGKRYICVHGVYWIREIRDAIAEEFSRFGYKFTQRGFYKCLFKFATLFAPDYKDLIYRWKVDFRYDTNSIKNDLGIQFIDYKKTLADMGHAMIDRGYLKDKRGNKKSN